MEIVVFSDSHGSDRNMLEVMKRRKNADIFLHLGDGAFSFTQHCEYENLPSRAVKGNCDFFGLNFGYELSDSVTFKLDGKVIFMTHGHKYSVDYSLDRLIYAAYEQNADILLFGHTHIPLTKYIPSPDEHTKPLYIMNPGSISRPREGLPSFGTITIKNDGILINTAEI